MVDVSSDQGGESSASSDGSHKLKVLFDDTELLSVSVGLQVMGKAVAAGGGSDHNWTSQITDYLKQATGLDKLLGGGSSAKKDESEGDASAQ